MCCGSTCPRGVRLRDEVHGLVVWRRGCFSICLPPRPFHVNMVDISQRFVSECVCVSLAQVVLHCVGEHLVKLVCSPWWRSRLHRYVSHGQSFCAHVLRVLCKVSVTSLCKNAHGWIFLCIRANLEPKPPLLPNTDYCVSCPW